MNLEDFLHLNRNKPEIEIIEKLEQLLSSEISALDFRKAVAKLVKEISNEQL